MRQQIGKIGIASLLLMFTLSFSQAYANAFYHGQGQRGGDDFGGMFFKEARIIQDNQEKLGLTADKMDAIKKLEIETRKTIIKEDADLQILSIDLTAKLRDYPVDVAAVDKLVAQKDDLKRAKAKNLVAAFAKLKGNLTREQYDMLKQLWRGKSQERRPRWRSGLLSN